MTINNNRRERINKPLKFCCGSNTIWNKNKFTRNLTEDPDQLLSRVNPSSAAFGVSTYPAVNLRRKKCPALL